MSFLAPIALGLGLLAGPVILMYMLRLRRREVQVSSTLLWQQLLRDREANAPWQRLKRNLLLLLQLLILAGLVLALARPYVTVPTVTSGRIALLIDASASMNATDVQPNRFEAARQQALSLVDSLNENDTLAVIRVAEGPLVAQNYTNDRVLLRAAINSLQPSQASADWDAAMTLAAAGAAGAEKFTIVLISDGGVPPSVNGNYGDVRFIPVGQSDSNLAITALAASPDPVNGPQIYARINNYGAQVADVVFSLKLDDALFNASTYTVPPNGYVDVVVPKLPATFRRVEGTLTRTAASTVPDYLSLDDVAWTVYNPAAAGRVLLMTKQNKFLEQGFASLDADWQAFRGQMDKGLPTEKFDLYVFDDWLPPSLPDGNLLIVNPPGDTALFKVGAVSQQASPITVKKDDPLTRFLKFNDVNIRQFKLITDMPWADALVSAPGGPLILAGQVDSRRVAIISFDLHDSDFPLKIGWPILLSNLTEWYKRPRSIDVKGSLQPGQTLTIRPSIDADSVQVQRPDGATTTLKADQAYLIYADTAESGIYSVASYKGITPLLTDLFAVNLFDPNESQIAVRTPVFGAGSLVKPGGEEIGQREFWPWVVLGALMVLMLEWYANHRRIQLPSLGSVWLRRFARRS